jgi:hypothetical protein
MSHTLGEREPAQRTRLLMESRALAVERFGRVPGPSPSIRLRLAKQALGRRLPRR